jgi:hypothetical protein
MRYTNTLRCLRALLIFGSVALPVASCQAISGVTELEVVDDFPDANAGSSGSAGAGGTAGSGGSAGTAGNGGTGGQSCTAPSQCPGADTDCARRTCEAGQCGVNNLRRGTVTAAQTARDCKRTVCDGTGGIFDEPDDTDIPNDDRECTTDLCSAGVPSHGNEPATKQCGTSPATHCDGRGNCIGCASDTECPADTPCANNGCNPTTMVCESVPRSNTTACGPTPTCIGGTATLQDFCDGSGACRDNGSRACSPYACGATACLTQCTADTHCANGHFCQPPPPPPGIRQCFPKKPDGQPCLSGNECVRGNCVDGVCCENGCGQGNNPCRSCNTLATGMASGLCRPIRLGQDPDNECVAGRACNGNGACTGVRVCDCDNPTSNTNGPCCINCNQECPSQDAMCNTQNGTWCIAGQEIYLSGGSAPDPTCPSAARCTSLICNCVP